MSIRGQTQGRRGELLLSNSVSHLIDADFSLYVLQALLDDADEGSRGNQSTIDVGLADVTLYTECKR